MKHTKLKCLWRASLLGYSNDKNNLKFRSHLRDYLKNLPEVYYLCEFSVHFLEVPAFVFLCKCYTIATYSFAYIYYRLRFTCGLFLSMIGWHHLIFYILCLFSYNFWDLIFFRASYYFILFMHQFVLYINLLMGKNIGSISLLQWIKQQQKHGGSNISMGFSR